MANLGNLESKSTTNPIMELQEGIDNTRYPDSEEPALIHPFLTSAIKLRNNGAIDIFTTTNLGIRIDSQSQTINLIADGQKEHLGYLRTWVQRDLEEHVGSNALNKIGGNWTVEIGGTLSFKSGGNMYFDAPNYYFK